MYGKLYGLPANDDNKILLLVSNYFGKITALAGKLNELFAYVIIYIYSIIIIHIVLIVLLTYTSYVKLTL